MHTSVSVLVLVLHTRAALTAAGPRGGTCCAAQVIAAEPSGTNRAADVAECKAAGQLLPLLPKPNTIADGLQGA